MNRKLLITVAVLIALMSMAAVASAGAGTPGCYVAAPATVNEGDTFTATVTCNTVTDIVFGFQMGTTMTGNATTAATSYTPGSAVTNPTHTMITAANTLSNYAVTATSLTDATLYASGNFTLGSFQATASKGLTSNGSVTIALPAASFKLSNVLGLVLSWRQSSPNANITVTDIPLALLSGSVTVQSDGLVDSLHGVNLTVGSNNFNGGSTSAGGNKSLAVNVGNLEYQAATKPALAVSISADMDSHLACTAKSYSLVDGADNAATQIGTITLKAGDVVAPNGETTPTIDINDATAIGLQFNSTTPTGEVDVNRDGTVDIYDLVSVGRNYGAVQAACS